MCNNPYATHKGDNRSSFSILFKFLYIYELVIHTEIYNIKSKPSCALNDTSQSMENFLKRNILFLIHENKWLEEMKMMMLVSYLT